MEYRFPPIALRPHEFVLKYWAMAYGQSDTFAELAVEARAAGLFDLADELSERSHQIVARNRRLFRAAARWGFAVFCELPYPESPEFVEHRSSEGLVVNRPHDIKCPRYIPAAPSGPWKLLE